MYARINLPDLAFGLFLIGLGALAYWLASDLGIGRAGAMGAGYVPCGLALIIMIYGAVLGIRALFAGFERIPDIEWRSLALISAAVAAFAILLPLIGLALTSVAVVVCAGFAARDVRLGENSALALGLAVFSVALFVYALGLPIAVWPEW